jgi:LPXTG-site transpeptidase (sortase) family protein
LVEGDIAQVATQDGRTYTYAFTSGRQVDPTDTSVLKQTSISPTLTLLTCDGFWDEKRRLMEFSFVSVK